MTGVGNKGFGAFAVRGASLLAGHTLAVAQLSGVTNSTTGASCAQSGNSEAAARGGHSELSVKEST